MLEEFIKRQQGLEDTNRATSTQLKNAIPTLELGNLANDRAVGAASTLAANNQKKQDSINLAKRFGDILGAGGNPFSGDKKVSSQLDGIRNRKAFKDIAAGAGSIGLEAPKDMLMNLSDLMRSTNAGEMVPVSNPNTTGGLDAGDNIALFRAIMEGLGKSEQSDVGKVSNKKGGTVRTIKNEKERLTPALQILQELAGKFGGNSSQGPSGVLRRVPGKGMVLDPASVAQPKPAPAATPDVPKQPQEIVKIFDDQQLAQFSQQLNDKLPNMGPQNSSAIKRAMSFGPPQFFTVNGVLHAHFADADGQGTALSFKVD